MGMLIILALLSTGCLIGMAIGSLLGYGKGFHDGRQRGMEMERHDTANWNRRVEESKYAVHIPHGSSGHICSTRCRPPENAARW